MNSIVLYVSESFAIYHIPYTTYEYGDGRNCPEAYLDIWLSPSGKYSYYWEQRAQRGIIYRHDNVPDFPHIKTHPQHLSDGNEKSIQPSYIDTNPKKRLRRLSD